MFHMLHILQDSTAAVAPTTPSELIMYWVTIAAGVLSGYAVKGLAKVNEFFANLNEAVKLAILAGLSFAGLKAITYFGLTLPSNPLSWDPTMVNTFIAAVLGWGVTKVGVKK